MRNEIFAAASYAFNPYAIPTLATAGAMLLLGVVVLFRERGSREAWHFALLAGPVSVWLACFSMMLLASGERVAMVWARSAYLGVGFIPAGLYSFTNAVTRSPHRRLMRTVWLISAAFVLGMVATGALVRDLYVYWWGFYPRFRWLGLPFLAFFFTMLVLCLREYWQDYRTASVATHRRRTRLLMTGFSIAYLGSLDFVAAYGVPLYPFGYLPVLCFIVLLAYSIGRYRLVDFTPAFAAGQILATVADPVIVCDSEGRIRFTNEAASTVLGYGPGELADSPIERLAEPSAGSAVRELVAAGEVVRGTEMIFHTRQGEGIDVEVSLSPLLDDRHAAVGAVLIARDIRARKLAESRIAYQAHHDALTGLPNRALLYDRLTKEVARSRRHGSRCLAVLFLDLDQFKVVNDTLGHAAGDHLLIEIAGRLRQTVRESDTVARVGGDEFTFLLPGIDRAEDAARTAQKILDAVSQPVEIGGHLLYVTTSIGISLYPADGEEPEALLSNADIAMYRAKDLGRNNFQLSNPAMNAKSVARLSLERDLRMALERGEFTLVYQPQADVASGRTVGVEALLRWNHPQRGLVLPGEFIAIAEETRLILPLGEWVLRTACEQARRWQLAGPGLRVAVNLSALQFRQRDLARTVQSIVGESGIDPGSLVIEITESAAMLDAGLTIDVLSELREMGLRIAIDDFGTGHASLSYLRQFPVDTLKIDRSFVSDMEASREGAAIVNAIVGLAHGLGLEVLAEGVENESQLHRLAACGCDEYQGFLISTPVDPAIVPGFLDRPYRAAMQPS